jgi:hypothetical protein
VINICTIYVHTGIIFIFLFLSKVFLAHFYLCASFVYIDVWHVRKIICNM